MKVFVWFMVSMFALGALFSLSSGSRPAYAAPTPYVTPTTAYQPQAATESVNRAWLRSWNENSMVYEQQACLVGLGYDVGPTGIDGISGPKTDGALALVSSKGGIDGLSEEQVDKCVAAITYVRAVMAEAERPEVSPPTE